jgi:uncharacterized membrane protein YhaH (DUF805 family)
MFERRLLSRFATRNVSRDHGETDMDIALPIAHLSFNLLVALAVFGATIVTDAVFVMFTAAVASRHRFRAANWSAIWYLLAAVSVISYTSNAIYVVFAAAGSWVGAYVSMTWLNRGESAVSPVRPGPP